MDKLSLFKSGRQKLRDVSTFSRNYRQADYKDAFLESQKNGGVKIPFGYSNGMLGHMMELRLWHIAYAPGETNKLMRMQEIHRINGELDYRIGNALYWRICGYVVLLLAIRKLGKGKYMNNGEQDSHEIDLKDNTATM